MNSSHYWDGPADHRALMSNYYRMQAPIYDLTRWMFLFGRKQIISDLNLKPGEVVVEVGCGTGRSFSTIRSAIGPSGELIALDCSEPMLKQARDRVRRAGWKNVRVIDHEYGWNTVTRGEADAVLFSYSLSMIPDWHSAVNCAREELKRTGRVGVLDFHGDAHSPASRFLAGWMAFNHVKLVRDYRSTLDRLFHPDVWGRHSILGSAFGYFRFVGRRRQGAQAATALRTSRYAGP